MLRPSRSRKLLDLLLIVAGIAAAQALYDVLFPSRFAYLSLSQRVEGGALSSLTLWAAIRAHDHTTPRSLRSLFDQLCMGSGMVLLLQAVLNYFHVLIRSMFLILAGATFAGLLLACAYVWLYAPDEESPGGALIVGRHPLMEQLARRLGVPVVGTVSPDATGDDPVAAASNGKRVSHILIAPPGEVSGALSAALLDYRKKGVAVLPFAQLYERLYQRVYGPGLTPAELLLSPSLEADSRAMALQAIYTNLAGLFLLLALSPVILLTALAVALFSGKGPVIESAECAGFHNIPFTRFRFRVLRADGSGRQTSIGPLLSRLHLDALPQLFNIVRGEMALFGPKAVRTAFAERMAGLMPFYALRFSVKPGLIGWSKVHLPGPPQKHTELERLEYDLYYIKEVSFWMDLDILLQWIFGSESMDAPVPQLSAQVE